MTSLSAPNFHVKAGSHKLWTLKFIAEEAYGNVHRVVESAILSLHESWPVLADETENARLLRISLYLHKQYRQSTGLYSFDAHLYVIPVKSGKKTLVKLVPKGFGLCEHVFDFMENLPSLEYVGDAYPVVDMASKCPPGFVVAISQVKNFEFVLSEVLKDLQHLSEGYKKPDGHRFVASKIEEYEKILSGGIA